jgi:hypothetical protein
MPRIETDAITRFALAAVTAMVSRAAVSNRERAKREQTTKPDEQIAATHHNNILFVYRGILRINFDQRPTA